MPSVEAPSAGGADLPVFGFAACHERPLADGAAQEAAWMRRAARTGRAAAHLWRGVQGLVVPRSYERAPRWHVACEDSAAQGWPVQVRASGGALVPQGPGVLNLTLVWSTPGGAPGAIDPIYRALCDELTAAFDRMGLTVRARAVSGAFCDGRFNLAAGDAKLVGTAQCWRRVEGVPVVMAHALMLVDADPAELTSRCNAFEAALGHGRRYRAEAVTSVARAWQATHGLAPPHDLLARTQRAIAERLARVLPPNVQTAGMSTSTPDKETIPWS